MRRLARCSPGGRYPHGSTLLPLILIFALLLLGSCSSGEGPQALLRETRNSYLQARLKLKELDEFFPEMEELLKRETGETLKKEALSLIGEKRNSYSSFLRSENDAKKEIEMLNEKGGELSRYASQLSALLEANAQEAGLIADYMLKTEALLDQIPLKNPADLRPQLEKLNGITGKIQELRDLIQQKEKEAEEFYQSHFG
jgi:hypothetical protein